VGQAGDVQATMCAHLVAQGTTQCATESVKRYVGYLRPIFYAACAPSDDYQACTSSDDGIVDVRKSFPSGHSSTAFCGLALLTLYLHHRVGMGSIRPVPLHRSEPGRLDSRTSQDENVVFASDPSFATNGQGRQRPILYCRLVSLVSMVFPMGLASFIACSRLVNNKHFPADVVAGATLGLGIAVYVGGLWWRPNDVW
jgi:diacylglycerol diphosphate phosphatase / phosphatidate phosphatase